MAVRMMMMPAEEMLVDEEAEPPHGCGRLVSRPISPEGQFEGGKTAKAGEGGSRKDHHSSIGHLATIGSIVYSIHSLPHALAGPLD